MLNWKILVIGSGGREWILAWLFSLCPFVKEIVCVPGNVGMLRIPKCRTIPNTKATDIPALIALALAERFDLTIVGPEDPLIAGIVNKWPKHLRIFGPTKLAARIEGSKVYAKKLMNRLGILNAKGRWFRSEERALAYLATFKDPGTKLVVKADGNALGKGVIVCDNIAEAMAAVHLLKTDPQFKDASKWIIIEERLYGKETSVIALCGVDGQVEVLPLAVDHKPVRDDGGPNTGGTGCYSPSDALAQDQVQWIMQCIIRPVMKATRFRGFMYVSVMVTEDGSIYVIEFNCRMGDPEGQNILPRILSKEKFARILYAIASRKLFVWRLEIDPRAAVTIVWMSEGYPGEPVRDKPIQGLEELMRRYPDAIISYAGVKMKKKSELGIPLDEDEEDTEVLVNSGGRVGAVTILAEDVATAAKIARDAASIVTWPGEHHRLSIGLGV